MLGTHIILDITVIRAPILVSKFVCGRAGHRKLKADLAFVTPHLLQDNPSSFVLTDLAEVRDSPLQLCGGPWEQSHCLMVKHFQNLHSFIKHTCLFYHSFRIILNNHSYKHESQRRTYEKSTQKSSMNLS